MISDVLSDAVDQIREYLTDPVFAEAYSGKVRVKIERVVEKMEELRAELDQHPTPGSRLPEGN